MTIPKAKEATGAVWDKLGRLPAWNLTKVELTSGVIAEALLNEVSVDFGTLMDLCHLKHSELSPELQKYKGRVVFRGDNVKDEKGSFAVFSEQGTSSSHQAAGIRCLSQISRNERVKCGR